MFFSFFKIFLSVLRLIYDNISILFKIFIYFSIKCLLFAYIYYIFKNSNYAAMILFLYNKVYFIFLECYCILLIIFCFLVYDLMSSMWCFVLLFKYVIVILKLLLMLLIKMLLVLFLLFVYYKIFYSFLLILFDNRFELIFKVFSIFLCFYIILTSFIVVSESYYVFLFKWKIIITTSNKYALHLLNLSLKSFFKFISNMIILTYFFYLLNQLILIYFFNIWTSFSSLRLNIMNLLITFMIFFLVIIVVASFFNFFILKYILNFGLRYSQLNFFSSKDNLAYDYLSKSIFRLNELLLLTYDNLHNNFIIILYNFLNL